MTRFVTKTSSKTIFLGLAVWATAGLAAGCTESEGDDDAASDDGTSGADDGKGDGTGDDGEAAIETLRGEEAFGELDSGRQDALERLVRPPMNLLSRSARAELDKLVDDAGYRALSLAEQAERLWGLTRLPMDFENPNPDGSFPGVLPKNAQVATPIALGSSPAELGEPVVSTRVGAPPPLDAQALLAKLSVLLDPNATPGPDDLIGPEDYADAPEDCAVFPLVVDGEEFTLTAPLVDGAPPDPAAAREYEADETSGGPLNGHSVEQLATAVAQMPAASRRLVAQFDLHARRNPIDSLFAQLYQRDDFRAYMLALIHPLGTVGVFPWPEPLDAADPNTLVHESGHIWTLTQWGIDPSSDGWREWIEASQADLLAPSTYADSSFLEDSAEMVLVFSAVRSMGADGEALAEEMRSLFPRRWEILERDLPE